MVLSVAAVMPEHKSCMKHSPVCNNRVQWMLNRLRDTLIPQKFVTRFFSIICTCREDLSQPIEDPWENVLSRHLIDSPAFIDNYISHNTDNVQANVIQVMMQHLRRHMIIPSKDDLARVDTTQWLDAERRTSAFKMLYLLQKAIEGNYMALEPPRRAVQHLARCSDISLTFVLEGFCHDHVGNLIGEGGHNILKFMKRYKCYVKFDKVPDGDNFKVKATIKKRAESRDVLERIKPELQTWAEDVQDLEESYVELRKQKLQEKKESLTELLKMTEGMGPTADWNTILIKIENHCLYENINRNVDFETQKQWFLEIRDNWNEICPPGQETLEETNVAGNIAADTTDSSGVPATIEQTVPKVVATPQSSQPRSDPQSSQPRSDPQSSQPRSDPQSSQPRSDPQSRPQSSSSCDQITSKPSVQSSPQPQAVAAMSVQDPGMASGTETSDCTSLCLVHDRRWMATFQYFLTQCYTQINLPRKYGYPFSQHICTCDKPKPDPLLYFRLHINKLDGFTKVKTYLKCWPEEQRTLVQPLIRQLEKYEKAETWHSLFKLVYYYTAMKNQEYEKLDAGAQLPGEPMQRLRMTPRSSPAPAQSAAPAQPRAEIGSDHGGASQGTIGSLHVSSLSQASKRAVPGGSNGPGASTGSPASPGAAGGIENNQPLKKKLRKLSPDDWIEDCYFHGKKKKFVFQCIINYLHRYARLPVKLNIPFSMSVCCCGETVEFKDFFNSEAECEEHCRFMRAKLVSWRGDSKASVQPFIGLLDEYINDKKITNGFLKFVFYFKKGFTGDLFEFHEIHDQLKQQRQS